MFHLLVIYRGWPDVAGTIPTGRIYINQNNEPGQFFLKNGKLEIAQITNEYKSYRESFFEVAASPWFNLPHPGRSR